MQERGKYKIGEYTFQTFHEYRDGQEDVRKIECINKELNIQDPEVAVRLYNDIRSGKIVFKSPIGDQFFAHLADIRGQGKIPEDTWCCIYYLGTCLFCCVWNC